MRILLTGAKGNLGSRLQHLGQKHQWIAINRDNWSQLESEMSKGCDLVVHAASDLLTPVAQNPTGVMNSNLNSTVEILNIMKKYAVSRIDFMSSCAVYGTSQSTKETQACAPISINGITKLLNEKIIQDFCRANKIEYGIFRIFNTLGGHDRFSILAQLKNAILQNRPFTLFNDGLSQRDFIHVDDVANVLLQLFEKPRSSEIVNIGSGHTTLIREIVTRAAKKNSKLEIRHAQREEAEYSRADISLLMQIIGSYSFKHIEEFVENEWDVHA